MALGLPHQRADRRGADRRGHDRAGRYATRQAGTARPCRRGHRDGGAGRDDLRGHAKRRSRLVVGAGRRAGGGGPAAARRLRRGAGAVRRPADDALRLFRIRGVAVGNGMLLLFGGITVAMWYFTSLFLQGVLGFNALQAGLGQTPAAVMFLVVARWAAALLPRTGVRLLVLAGGGCFLTGFGWLAQAGADSGYVTGVLGPTLFVALGIGLTFPTLMAAATADVPEGEAGIVGGLANTTSQVGGSIGLAVLATAAGAETASQAAASSPAAALATGYDLVFLMAAGLGLAIAAVSVLLPRHRRT
ncbi:MFS transporter [Nonomuraea antimicrobica]